MEISKFINIGSEESPVEVPDFVLNTATPAGKEFWENVANGSVVLGEEVLDKLLELTKDFK